MPNEQRALKVFLCHAHSDKSAVRDLYLRLTKDGVDAWLDKEKLLPGQDWEYEIRRAVRESDVVVVCLSKQFSQAGFRQKEVRLALDAAMEKPEGEIFIIPARLEECDTVESLGKWNWVDLFEHDGYERLLMAFRARASNIGATLRLKKRTAHTKRDNLSKQIPESIEKQGNGQEVKKKSRKPDTAIIVALIGFAGTVFAALLASPLIEKWETSVPTPVISATTVIATSIPGTSSQTVEPSLTLTESMTVIVTPYAVEISDVDPSGNSISMRLIPAGEFIMGSDVVSQDERPAHKLNLNSFYIDKYEVTNALYEACVVVGVCQPPKDIGSQMRSDYFGNAQYDNYPVVYVDWYMAKTYCDWRTARLPTEAEWEKSARGTNGRTYPWGESISCAYANYRDADSYCIGDTAIVGNYEMGKSMYDVYDMAGNVWEWVSSLYQPFPYNAKDGREDLTATGRRVLKGGSWFDIAISARSSDRTMYEPMYVYRTFGFRCAKDAIP